METSVTYGKWPTTNTDPDVKLYCDIKDELTIKQNGTILRSHRICVPKILQKEIVDIAHCGHQGMTKTKQLLREKVWFPSMDRIAEEKVKNCFSCQAVTPQNTCEPIQVTLTNRAKGKMKSYADKRRHTKKCDIKVGDKVLYSK